MVIKNYTKNKKEGQNTSEGRTTPETSARGFLVYKREKEEKRTPTWRQGRHT